MTQRPQAAPLARFAFLTALALALPAHATPSGADIADLDHDACLAALERAGVSFKADDAGLLLVDGPIGGVDVEFVGRRETHAKMDCRMVAAMQAWSGPLRAAGVRRVRHLSVYRPGATVANSAKPSGHAAALALDLRYLDFDDGHSLDVLADWGDATHDAPPCPAASYSDDPSTTIRELVCAAGRSGLFETIITPHHNEAHANHVHVELVPDVDWQYIH